MKRSFDEHHQNRSESPRSLDERLAVELRNQKPSENENEIEGGVVSPISPRAAVTYANRSHKLLRVFNEGGNLQENEHAIVEIRQCDNPSNRHNMKVIVTDHHHDFVLLYSVSGNDIFDDYPFTCRSPRNFEWFVGYGLSFKNKEGQQITFRSGKICSVMVDYRGQMLASVSVDGGDSGGPCFGEDRSLIGIIVSSTMTDPVLGPEYEFEEVEDELRDASCSPANTWITPGNLILEANRTWQVSQGMIKARKNERERAMTKEFEDKYKELEKVCQAIMRKIHEPAASQSCGNQNGSGFAQGNYPSSGPTVEEVD